MVKEQTLLRKMWRVIIAHLKSHGLWETDMHTLFLSFFICLLHGVKHNMRTHIYEIAHNACRSLLCKWTHTYKHTHTNPFLHTDVLLDFDARASSSILPLLLCFILRRTRTRIHGNTRTCTYIHSHAHSQILTLTIPSLSLASSLFLFSLTNDCASFLYLLNLKNAYLEIITKFWCF